MDFVPTVVAGDDGTAKKDFLLVGQVLSLVVALISLPIIAVCFYQRLVEARRKRYCRASSYFASALYIFTITILIHPDFRRDLDLCDAILLTCLTLYALAKTFALAFLIERAYIISRPTKTHHGTLEYVLTAMFVFVPYITATVLCIVFRMRLFTEQGICVMGLKTWALVFMTVVELGSYLYLTLRFLYPLISVHFGGNGLLLPLKGLVTRTVVGTAISTLTTLGVKIMLMVFNGQSAWLCCMTCQFDAFLGALILHWVTKPDHDHPPPLHNTCALEIAISETPTSSPNEGSTPQKQGAYFPSQRGRSLCDIL